jgi:hypothetical protein
MAREMKLTDPAMASTIPQFHPSQNSIEQSVASNYNRNIGSILNSDYPDNAKLPAYNDTLRRYNNMTQKRIHVNRDEDPQIKRSMNMHNLSNIDREIIASVPKTLTYKAKRLLSRIKDSPNISFDNQGRVTINDELLPDANIVDLIYSAISTKKNISQPPGWQNFNTLLQDSGVPLSLLGATSRPESGTRLQKLPIKKGRAIKSDEGLKIRKVGLIQKRKPQNKTRIRDDYLTRSTLKNISKNWEVLKI